MFFFLSHNPILTFFNVHTKYQSIFTHQGLLIREQMKLLPFKPFAEREKKLLL